MKKRTMSAEARKKISDAMKARHAAAKKHANNGGSASDERITIDQDQVEVEVTDTQLFLQRLADVELPFDRMPMVVDGIHGIAFSFEADEAAFFVIPNKTGSVVPIKSLRVERLRLLKA